MIATEPNVAKTGRYSLEETAKLLGVHPNTIIRYAKMGKLRYGVRRTNSRKFYTGMEILRFWRSEI